MPSAYAETLDAVARARLPGLQRRLQRRFPAVSEGQVEDALQDALAEACTPERNAWFVDGFEHGGEDEVARRLFTSAWRHLRGALRKVGTRRTDRLQTGFDAAASGHAPDDHAAAKQALSRLGHLVDDAAARFGRRRVHTLERALRSMLDRGHAVKPLASRYRLPRRYLAEASVWVRRQLAPRPPDDDER